MNIRSFGDYLVSDKVISKEDIDQAIRVQCNHSSVLEDLSVRLQLLDYDDVRRIRREQDRLEMNFSESAQSLNLLNEDQLQNLHSTLFNNHTYLSNAIMSYSYVGQTDIREHLCEFQKIITYQNQAACSTIDDLCPDVSQSVVNLITGYFYRDGHAVRAKTSRLQQTDTRQHEVYAAEHIYRNSGNSYLSFLFPQPLNQLLAYNWRDEPNEHYKRDTWDIVSENLFNLNYILCRNLRQIGYKVKHGVIQNILPNFTKSLCIKFDGFIGSFYVVYSDAV